ncbi:phage baseplate assembly protein [Paraburkholderia aromaticivorans]|uniref:phage baseplate assembly protein n=1 Tax=Paraburkholderia aromaticivorans TaxID=2026199 RepID=UPI00145600B9|nr:Mu P family protein [Paraburkholderia aromaticivorans]
MTISTTDTTVKLVLINQEIAGWTEVRITRGIERLPSDFELDLTELFPSEAPAVVVTPGDPCVIMIGSQTVLTGYVDKYVPSFGPEGHSIRVTGRGKCQDLVDCSAEWETSQISAATAFVIASNLASAYDILVDPPETSDVTVPQFNIMLGETAFEVIDRICKYSGLLAYEGVSGHLVMSRVGTEEHASGLFEGQNVTAGSVEYSMDQRYSTYIGWLNAMSRIGNSFDAPNSFAVAADATVLRNRKKFVIAEAANGYKDMLSKRVAWEMNRRAGRSKVARVRVDSWLDSSSALWTPNKLASVYLPTLKPADANNQPLKWTIGEVSYVMDGEGTSAELTLMDPSAFAVQPAQLNYGFIDEHVAV